MHLILNSWAWPWIQTSAKVSFLSAIVLHFTWLFQFLLSLNSWSLLPTLIHFPLDVSHLFFLSDLCNFILSILRGRQIFCLSPLLLPLGVSPIPFLLSYSFYQEWNSCYPKDLQDTCLGSEGTNYLQYLLWYFLLLWGKYIPVGSFLLFSR